MLKFISIQNFAIIDQLEIDFGPGFNLITGETGSGKSILVDAVGLLAGARAQQEMIRQGSDSAVVEGLFQPVQGHPCWEVLEKAGFDKGDGDIIVRRELSQNGNNRAYINSRLVPLSLVLELGSRLIDIHGQHAQQELLTPGSHLGYLDQYAGNQNVKAEYAQRYREFRELEQKLAHLEDSEKNRLQRLDLLKFQIDEIEQLKPDPESDALLEEEKKLLANAEIRLSSSRSAYNLMYEDDLSVLTLIDQALRKIEPLKAMDPSLEDLDSRILNLRYYSEEISYSLRDYMDKIEVNPNRLEMIEDRLNEIDKLKRKYGSDIPEILEYLERIKVERKEIEESELRDRQLGQARNERFNECLGLALRLRESRKKAASSMEAEIERELAVLAMKNVKFEICFAELPEPSAEGMDQLEFLISTNKGELPRPLAKIASGGELSRIMLALRTVLKSGTASKSMIFDEVDAGIGGKTASILGEKLARLSEHQQVFCVTHLPQVAACGKRHYHVGKGVYKDRTRATIRLLDQRERIEELSRLMGGDTVSDTTRKQAWEMLSRRSNLIETGEGKGGKNTLNAPSDR